MELRTYLSLSQVMVVSLVLIFSEWHLAAPKNDEVLQITFGKGFNAIVTVRSNFVSKELSHNLDPKFQVRVV